MAYEACAGRWRKSRLISSTTVQVEQDGIIIVDPPNASGEFSGRHLNSGGPVHGRCYENPARIEMVRQQGNTTVTYSGRIAYDGVVDEYFIIGGTYTKITEGGKRELDSDNGDWTSEKST